jgi:hypothetical protein
MKVVDDPGGYSRVRNPAVDAVADLDVISAD